MTTNYSLLIANAVSFNKKSKANNNFRWNHRQYNFLNNKQTL